MNDLEAVAFLDKPSAEGWSVAPWGEKSRPRVRARQTGERLSVLELRSPPDFGPVRHVHLEDDEIYIVTEGCAVFWLETKTMVAKPGDLVFLPRKVPHAWYVVGKKEFSAQLITAPGQFERWLELVVSRSLDLNNMDGLIEAGLEAGMTVTGPPLTRQEADEILNSEKD